MTLQVNHSDIIYMNYFSDAPFSAYHLDQSSPEPWQLDCLELLCHHPKTQSRHCHCRFSWSE